MPQSKSLGQKMHNSLKLYYIFVLNNIFHLRALNFRLRKVSKNDEAEKAKSSPPREPTFSDFTSTHLFLQTLSVEQKKKQTYVARALINTESQKFYVLKRAAAQLGYKPKLV